jgi:hypothetical protein
MGNYKLATEFYNNSLAIYKSLDIKNPAY